MNNTLAYSIFPESLKKSIIKEANWLYLCVIHLEKLNKNSSEMWEWTVPVRFPWRWRIGWVKCRRLLSGDAGGRHLTCDGQASPLRHASLYRAHPHYTSCPTNLCRPWPSYALNKLYFWYLLYCSKHLYKKLISLEIFQYFESRPPKTKIPRKYDLKYLQLCVWPFADIVIEIGYNTYLSACLSANASLIF